MANILLRSPYYFNATVSTALSAKLELSVGGTLRYTIVKPTDSNNNALFEVSELVRDYLDINFGNNEVTDGSFVNDAASWIVSGDVSIANGVATFTNTDELSSIKQNSVFVDENYYEITYEIKSSTSGGLRIPRFIVDDTNGSEIPSTVGVHTVRGKVYDTALQIKRSGDPTSLSITNISVNGGYSSQVAAVTGTIKFYTGLNATGTLISASTITLDEKGFDGYKEYPEDVDGKPQIDNNTNLISNTTLYVPEGVAGVIPNTTTNGTIIYTDFSSTATSITVNSVNFTIVRLCEPKYNPIKVTFVNKFGALQDIYFDKKSEETVSVKRNKYKRSLSSPTDGSFSATVHQNRTFNVVANESISLTTGFVDEGMNEPIKQLLFSEQCWATINDTIFPVTPRDRKKTLKTSVNDKLISHKINFDYAYDLINRIR